MSEQQKNIVNKVARGHVQRAFVSALLTHGKTEFQHHVYATIYYNSYISSFRNVLQRLKNEGISATWHKGKQGGYWTSYITLD